METLRDDMSITIKVSKNAFDTRCERGYFCRKHECTWWIDERCELASHLTPVASGGVGESDGEDVGESRPVPEHNG